MAVGMAVALRNARLDAITTFTGGSALLRIYDGSRPATGGAAQRYSQAHSLSH